MKTLGILFSINLLLPLTAVACPIGMVYNGNGCSPPYEYTGWDLLRDRRAYIDSIGADRPKASAPGLSREEAVDLKRRALEAQQEKEREREKIAKGLWHFNSTSTPEGKLCVATFAKYTSGKDGLEGGLVTIMGFQHPKSDAWLMFQGTELPKPRDVQKLKVTIQQDDEPAQTVQVFNYRKSREVGEVAFAVPGLMAALDGMRDEQSFELSLDEKTLMTIKWANAAPFIGQLRQCVK
ncbi:hypothetical protein [Methylotenera sp.]|uniref:hypothetical protein n=1 Tax=Methylotenera sp. TaxID=2051956 RepID=UPI00272FFE63|nr:hypothetical protein [Methylotenera sp.]MDP2070371.1 hypothetical protein [Methylotenera sp.]MDP3004586.1 hypothetical protein [Methylotenera sp.]MDP3306883.1 hypothetical protein [Methylotenera sp.]MDZ4211624.1 hypothetical protein [Methylotenera sp.]